MDKSTFNRKISDYQLITLGINLVHSVIGLKDCSPELENNMHYTKALAIAECWNDAFIDMYVSAKEGK